MVPTRPLSPGLDSIEEVFSRARTLDATGRALRAVGKEYAHGGYATTHDHYDNGSGMNRVSGSRAAT